MTQRSFFIVIAWLIAGLLLTCAALPETISVQGRDLTAINSAMERSNAGDIVHLPAGIYEVSGAIEPRSETDLVGDGQERTIIRFVGEDHGVMVRLAGCHEVRVAGLTLDAMNNAHCMQGIVGNNAKRLIISRVTIRNLVKSKGHGPHGVHFSGVSPTRQRGVTESIIRDCTIENIGTDSEWGAGIRMSWGSSRNQVLRNTIRNTGRGGIFGDNGSNDLIIRRNNVSGSGGRRLGIEVWGGCDRAVIEDNTIDHWLSIGGCDWFAVRRNVVSATDGTFGGYGLEIIGSYGIVTDNLVNDGQCIGISVSGKSPKEYVYYGYNTIESCSQWGAQFQGEEGGIARNYLYRCKFVGTTKERGKVPYPGHEGNGFRTNGHCRHLVFDQCSMSGNARYGVQLGGPDVDHLSFVACRITDNAGSAVVGPHEYTALSWQDCIVEGNANDRLPLEKAFAANPPVADFDMPKQAVVGQRVEFTSTPRDTTGNIDVALWDFGDGAPVTGSEVTHVFRRPGTYRITLVVWDEAGRGARKEKTLEVVNPKQRGS